MERERIVRLSLSKQPLLVKLFGLPPLLVQPDPAVHKSIIRQAERQVYGPTGLEQYEQQEMSSLKRLACRSLAQFLCKKALYIGRWVHAGRRIIFGLALGPLLALFLSRTLLATRNVSEEAKRANVVVFLNAERFRKLIENQFGAEGVYIHITNSVHLGRVELGFLGRTLFACPRYLLHPELLSNVLRWLSFYGYVVHHFNPRAIVNFIEGTPSSSLLTAYLRERGIRHLNLMHGDLLFHAHTAFCEFDEFRVWGQHFVDLFAKMQCPMEQFVVVGTTYHQYLFNQVRPAHQPRPKCLLIVHTYSQSVGTTDYMLLVKVLQALDCSWEVYLRRHPSDRRAWLEYMEALNAEPTLVELGIQVQEDTYAATSIEQALAECRVVVGVVSTALLEAWIAGCKTIYLKWLPHRSSLIERYNDSRNVIYVDDETVDVKSFLQEPAALDSYEDSLVEYVTHVLPNGGRGG